MRLGIATPAKVAATRIISFGVALHNAIVRKFRHLATTLVVRPVTQERLRGLHVIDQLVLLIYVRLSFFLLFFLTWFFIFPFIRVLFLFCRLRIPFLTITGIVFSDGLWSF